MKSEEKDELLESSSEESGSEDDDDGWKLTEEVEKEFYKTLSQIKNKDPKIYKKDVEFFKDVPIPEVKTTKTKKSTPLTLRDYERKIITEKGGKLSDEDSEIDKIPKPKGLSYVEEQDAIKKSFWETGVNSGSEEESEEEFGGLLKVGEKTKDEKNEQVQSKEEETYKWLKGEKDSAPDEEVEKEMKPLREYWTNPSLDEDDQFLRDYVLNKRFLENDDKSDHEDNSDVLSQESDTVDEQSEVKLNHRFEEPDQEYVKRYPRVMENSIRKKNDHRKQKREEIRERKLKEKQKKIAERNKKKKLKKKEIEKKLEELKKFTEIDQLDFQNNLDKDFDLDEHDKAMQRLFNEEFYSKDDTDFNPHGSADYGDAWNEEGGYEDNQGDYGGYEEPNGGVEEDEPYCEDPNFIMDCDYDPSQEKPKEKTRSRRRKDKHRRTTVSEAVNKAKPKFDPLAYKSFQDYLDDYYAIDCEDFIGDLPCRFKYRRTVPNSYGLTVEEILAADENELERWCSIKRIHQKRPDHIEKHDLKVYKMKAKDERLKRKILPSLFKKPDEIENVKSEKEETAITKSQNKLQENCVDMEDNSLNLNETTNKTENTSRQSSLKPKKKKKLKHIAESAEDQNIVKVDRKRKIVSLETKKNKMRRKSSSKHNENGRPDSTNTKKFKNKSKTHSKHTRQPAEDSGLSQLSDARLLAYGIKPKRFRNALKYKKGAS